MITIGKKWTDKELKYLRDNIGTISAYQMAKKLGRPNTTVWEKVKRLKESECELKKPAVLTTAQKLEALEERFKNPLLRVAVFRNSLPANWTPIDRLSDLVFYSGIYQKGVQNAGRGKSAKTNKGKRPAACRKGGGNQKLHTGVN